MSEPARKLDALTGLRFVAAAAIVLHHSRATILPAKVHISFALSAGVSFFFVLSGFILTYVYPRLQTGGDCGRFLLARFARVWPGHVFALLLVFLLLPAPGRGLPPGDTPRALIVVLLHSLVPRYGVFFGWNNVAWSVSTELCFYLLFPLLIWQWRRTWFVKLPLVLLLVYAVIRHANTPALLNPADPLHDPSWLGWIYPHPASRLFEFALGMTVALVWSGLPSRWAPGRLLGTVLEVVVLAVAVVVPLYSAELLWAKVQAHPSLGMPGAYWVSCIGVPALPFALVVLAMASQRGWISRGLASRPLVLLGEVSFSVYLLHQVLIRWYLMHQLAFMRWPPWLTYSVFWAVLLLLAHLVWAGFERPLRRLLVGLWPRPEEASRAGPSSGGGRGAMGALLSPGRRLLAAEVLTLALAVAPLVYAVLRERRPVGRALLFVEALALAVVPLAYAARRGPRPAAAVGPATRP
jgi:peptidoglycan/LPS O-acetylase OafA/YrhL